jgi:hypothetical protein
MTATQTVATPHEADTCGAMRTAAGSVPTAAASTTAATAAPKRITRDPASSGGGMLPESRDAGGMERGATI